MTPIGVPEGITDYLPPEAGRLRWAEGVLRGLFQRYGGGEVILPSFDFWDNLRRGGGIRDEEKVYKFFDRRGRILALRPDMTAPIARAAAYKLKDRPVPWRLFYFGSVFRSGLKGQEHEVYQAGFELIGAGGILADTEVLLLGTEALGLLGFKDYRVGLGHMGVLESLLEKAGLNGRGAQALKESLQRKDLVRAREVIAEARDPAVLRRVLLESPPVEDLARLVGDASGIGEIFGILGSLGLMDKVYLDLSLVRDLDYYTGPVFEGYVDGCGSPVLAGGRYDGLLERFGLDQPATGLAISLSSLVRLLGDGVAPEAGRVVETGDDPVEAFIRAAELRKEGFVVELDVLGGGDPQ